MDDFAIQRLDTVTRHGRTSIYTVGGFSDTVTMHMDTGSVATTTAFMLIDISDTVNWKHTKTGHIILDYILLQADPDSTYLGEIKVGYLTNVDADNGDFIGLFDLDLAKKSDLVIEELEFGSHGMHCQTETHFGPIEANNVLFQTDVNLQGPSGATAFPSGNADLVMIVEQTNGAVNVSVTIGYEAVA